MKHGRKIDLTEEQLAELVNAFWRRQGLRANARVETIKAKSGLVGYRAVRSNMLNGTPRETIDAPP
jgi:hypothetical protein